MTTLFPSILPGNDEFVDDSYSKSELAGKEWDELRKIAKEHPKETVNGRSDKETIIDELAGETRV
jgi:hypothetical protein